jgi:SAM-dependent methyltransferase
MTEPVHRGFDQVDTVPQPGSLVDYLDRVATSAAGADYTRGTLQALGLGVGQRVLDVGCGSGHALQAAAELVGSSGLVVGITAAATMATAAQARLAGHPTARVCLADAQHLPFANGVFDGCRAARVLQHLPDPAGALAEMARVTRPGGLVLVPGPCAHDRGRARHRQRRPDRRAGPRLAPGPTASGRPGAVLQGPPPCHGDRSHLNVTAGHPRGMVRPRLGTWHTQEAAGDADGG